MIAIAIPNEPPPLESFQNLIYKQAHYCFDRLPNPKDFDDLKHEAVLVYLICCGKYDPSRSIKFITYFTTALRNRYAGILDKNTKHVLREKQVEEIEGLAKHKQKDKLQDLFWCKLSKKAWIVARILYEKTDTINKRVKPKEVADKLGLTVQEIQECYYEIAYKVNDKLF